MEDTEVRTIARSIRKLRPFAADLGVHELYKLREYQSTKDKVRVREILVEHKVWFSKPSQLNDPFDLRPLINMRRFSTDTENRFLLRMNATQIAERDAWDIQRREMALHRIRHLPIETLQQEATNNVKETLEQHGVFSLSSVRGSVELWERYAGDGTGLCIHFHSDASSIFGGAQRVSYFPHRPVLDFPFVDISSEDVGAIALLSKTENWAAESEYRLIRFPHRDLDDFGLHFRGQYAHFSPNLLAGVTIGHRMPTREAREVRRMTDALQLPLWRITGNTTTEELP